MQSISILLVEDSPTDQRVTMDALTSGRLINSVNVVENALEALAFLRQEGNYTSAPPTQLVLVGLSPVARHGLITAIKADTELSAIPVIALPAPASENEGERCEDGGANGRILKPVRIEALASALKTIENFWFDLVASPSQARPGIDSTASPSRDQQALLGLGDTVRVLLIEDSVFDAMLVRRALVSSPAFDFEVATATNLAEARAVLSSETFDVILTDLRLPEIQGIETYRAVRQLAPRTPILVLTGTDDENLGMQALRLGAQDYLVKGQWHARALPRAVRHAIEKAKLQEHLRQSQQLEAVGRLAGGVAHDFNNLLTVISASGSLIEESDDPEVRKGLTAEILKATTSAANLTRQLLTFSRRQSTQPRALDINRVVADFVKMLGHVLGADIRLELHLAAQLPPVFADPGALEQVVLNLAMNARDSMPGGGKVSVSTRVVELDEGTAASLHSEAYAGRFVTIAVRDAGSGIEQAHLSQIWEPFFSTKEARRGTGLGLATVHGAVTQNGGWITVDSEMGKGSTFEVYLPENRAAPAPSVPAPSEPAQSEPAQSEPAEAEPAPEPEERPATILIVEDEEPIRALTRRILASQGYAILAAANAEEALEIWETQGEAVDLLLTDIVLGPGLSGNQLAKQLLEKKPELLVVAMTGYSEELNDSVQTAYHGGNLLSKPFSIADLRAMVRDTFARGAAVEV